MPNIHNCDCAFMCVAIYRFILSHRISIKAMRMLINPKRNKNEEQMLGWHPLFNFQSKCTRLVNKMEKYETIAYKKNTNSHRHFTGKQYTGYLHGGHLQINSYKTWWNIVSEARQPNRLHRMPIQWFIYVYI